MEPNKTNSMVVAIEEQIAAHAYRLWEGEGRPSGRAVTHWLLAERELGRGSSRGTAGPVEPTALGSVRPRRSRGRSA